MFKAVGEVILDILFPKFCCGCSKLDTYLCGSCFNSLELLSSPIKLSLTNHYIKKITAVCYYDKTVKELIHTYKYDSVKDISETIAQFIFYTTTLPQVDYITAVPLHPKRQLERGFNQSELVARTLAQYCTIQYSTLLKREVSRSAQATIVDFEARQENIAGQFAIAEVNITGKSILIFDDVCTTGATLNECAKILLNHGAASAEGLVLAHGS
jgi:ComF family protein